MLFQKGVIAMYLRIKKLTLIKMVILAVMFAIIWFLAGMKALFISIIGFPICWWLGGENSRHAIVKPIILLLVERANGEANLHSLNKEVISIFGLDLLGSLIVSLILLEKRKFIESEKRYEGEEGGKTKYRKYYKITPKGRYVLEGYKL